MVTTLQSYQLNNKIVDVDLTKVPVFSIRSKEILVQQLSIYLPPSLETAAPLTGRVLQMEETAKLLAEAQENWVKNLAVGCLKTALMAACLAGAILSTIYGGELAPLYSTFAWMGFYAISLIILMDLSDIWGQKSPGDAAGGAAVLGFGLIIPLIDAISRAARLKGNFEQQRETITTAIIGNGSDLIWGRRSDGSDIASAAVLGFGLIIPLVEVFTRVSRLKGNLGRQREAIDAALGEAQEKNKAILSQGYQFFKEHSPELLVKLNERIEQSQKSFATLQQLSERSPAGEKDLMDRLAALRQAKEELNAIAQFYQQFDAQ